MYLLYLFYFIYNYIYIYLFTINIISTYEYHHFLGAESKVPVGILEVRLELIPNLGADNNITDEVMKTQVLNFLKIINVQRK